MDFDIIKSLNNEFVNECANTRKLLAAVPLENPAWKPHEKSMQIHDLAVHIADLPNYVSSVLDRKELDWATEKYVPKKATTTEELLKIHDDAVISALKSIQQSSADSLKNETFSMRNGEHVYFTIPKIAALRNIAMNHLYHHRGQLTVYLRLLNIPVPGMYGPTADFPM